MFPFAGNTAHRNNSQLAGFPRNGEDAVDEIKEVHQMKRIHAMAAAALIAVVGTAAIAQTKPDGNVPTGQGLCARGYEASAPNGRMRLSADIMRRVDLNNNGNISKTEFDAACTQGLFEDGKDG